MWHNSIEKWIYMKVHGNTSKINCFLSYLLVILVSLLIVFTGIFLMPFELKAFWEFSFWLAYSLMWVFLFLPLFTFFTAGWHKVSTKPYLVLCCYFHVLPVGHFISKECKENSGTEKWIAYQWVHPCLVFTQNASSGEVFIFGWRIISKCLLYFCTVFYIAYIFLKFHIATLFSIPHMQKLFVLALCNV